MKKQVLYVWFLVVLLLCNNVSVFAVETESTDSVGNIYEETIEEATVVEEISYPSMVFADKSIPGISVEGSVDEGVLPSGTTMNVRSVKSDTIEQIRIATDDYLNGNQKVVDLTAIDISFSNEGEAINPKDGKIVNIIIRSDTLVEGKKYIVVCLKNDNTITTIPSIETILTDSSNNDEYSLNHKIEVSFDIKESSIYTIIEVEDMTSSTTTEDSENETVGNQYQDNDETTIDQNENETLDNQDEEVESSAGQSEVYENEIPVIQEEEGLVGTSTEQNDEEEYNNSSESKEAEKTESSTEEKNTEKSESSTEQKGTEKSESSTEEKDTEKSKSSTEQKNAEESKTSTQQNDTKKSENPTERNNEKETTTSVDKTEKIKVLVEVKWDDEDNKDGIRPEDIMVYLLANGKRVDAAAITEKSQWKRAFENLPEYEADKKITYTVEVGTFEGYTTTIDGFTIKSTHKTETLTIKGKVVWDDENNHDSIRPESVIIKLLANGEKIDETPVSEDDEWMFSFENLPKYKSGKKIKYSVEQKEVNGYKTKLNGFDVINTHSLETVTIEGIKMWDDSSNKDGIRPESVTINLNADGKKIDTTTASKKSDWKYSFGSLPKYKSGKEIVYTIEEVPVEGYQPEYYGFNITNIHKAGTVNKSDSDNNSNKAPKVGDNNNIILWIVLITVSVTVFLALIIFGRKK